MGGPAAAARVRAAMRGTGKHPEQHPNPLRLQLLYFKNIRGGVYATAERPGRPARGYLSQVAPWSFDRFGCMSDVIKITHAPAAGSFTCKILSIEIPTENLK